MSLARACYELARQLPDYERYGLASQLRRSAVSIPSNIAEGAGRGSDKEFARFLLIAHASGNELETQLLLSRDFGFVSEGLVNGLVEELLEIRRMLMSLSTRATKSAS